MMRLLQWCGCVRCLPLHNNTSFVKNLSNHKMWGIILQKIYNIWGNVDVTFLSLNKKVTKEVSIGEAFMPPPGVRYTLPYVPLP